MKKTNIWFAALIAIGLLQACGGEKQLKEYAQGYLDAMGNYRPAEARPFATAETCDNTLAFYETLMAFTDSSVFRNNIPAHITLGEITYSDDTCATVAFHKSTPTRQQDGTLHLVKRRGKWLVHEVLKLPKMPDAAPEKPSAK